MTHHEKRKTTYLRPDLSMSLIAIRMQGSMSKHVTPLAKMDADSPSIPMLASKSPAPDCIKIWGVKYNTALMPLNCTCNSSSMSMITQNLVNLNNEGTSVSFEGLG